MTIKSKENIIQLQVTVYDAVFVEILECKTNLGSVEPVPCLVWFDKFTGLYLLGTLCTKLTSLDVQHQISTTNIFHDKVDSRLRLETGMQIQQEWMTLLVRNQEHPLFGSRTLDFVILNDELLLQNFDGV